MALLYRMGTGNGSGGDLKPYTVNFECASGYIGQTLTMTYKGTPHAGETVDNVSGTVGSDGTLTLYPMHSGEWECSCYSSVIGTTTIKTIDLSYWGVQPNVTFEDTPNGATATPTDDVQTWLHCANIWDKSYETVAEVVADKTILNALVQDGNANDYLVRSTTFANTLCENNVNNEAMYYLGLYSECANKLLADSTWCEAICNADVLLSDGTTYLFEKVLNVSVPTMTSNTMPSGVASASNYQTGCDPYKAFDRKFTDGGNYWSTNQSSAWIQYEFPNPMYLKKVHIKQLSASTRTLNMQTQVSDDGVNFAPIGDSFMTSSTKKEGIVIINSTTAHKYVRLVFTSSDNYCMAPWLQFYGREEA